MLHFNEDQATVPVHYYIDLSRSTPEISFNEVVALGGQVLGGTFFSEITPEFGVHVPPRGPES